MSEFTTYIESLHRCNKLGQPLWINNQRGISRLVALVFKELPALSNFKIGNDTNRSFSSELCLWEVNGVTLDQPISFQQLNFAYAPESLELEQASFNSFLVEIDLNVREFQIFIHALAPLSTIHLSDISPAWEFFRTK